MDWESLSEVVFGLLLKGKITADACRPEMFCEPYEKGVELYKQGHNEVEYMVARLGISPVQACIEAANQVNGNKFDFVGMLETAHLRTVVANQLEIAIRKLRKGEEVEFAEIVEKFSLLDGGIADLIPMDQIVPEEMPFQPTGWQAIDDTLGGIPKSGLITVGGSPGAGKTTFFIRLMKEYLTTNPQKLGLTFTLEMPGAEFVARALDITKFSKDLQKRHLICDGMLSIEELANKASKYKGDAGLICIDFADLLIKRETSESEMANIYLTCASLAKRMGIPVILLSQLNRNYVGGLPRPTYLRYTSLAEALSWNIWMLYNPNTDFHTGDDEGALSAIDGMGYLLSWKQRGGWRVDQHEGPGAAQIAWTGKEGWGDTCEGWFKLKTQ